MGLIIFEVWLEPTATIEAFLKVASINKLYGHKKLTVSLHREFARSILMYPVPT